LREGIDGFAVLVDLKGILRIVVGVPAKSRPLPKEPPHRSADEQDCCNPADLSISTERPGSLTTPPTIGPVVFDFPLFDAFAAPGVVSGVVPGEPVLEVVFGLSCQRFAHSYVRGLRVSEWQPGMYALIVVGKDQGAVEKHPLPGGRSLSPDLEAVANGWMKWKGQKAREDGPWAIGWQ
jgi:hypothetical protein